MTSNTDNTDLSALTAALDDTAARIRELNEKGDRRSQAEWDAVT